MPAWFSLYLDKFRKNYFRIKALNQLSEKLLQIYLKLKIILLQGELFPLKLITFCTKDC